MSRFRVLSKNMVKLLCMLTMFMNHFSYWFLEPGSAAYGLCVYIGWVTAPCMCWFLVQGFYHTHDRRKYGLRLLAFAAISQWPFMLYFYDAPHVNMIGTLFICYLGLCVRRSRFGVVARSFLQVLLFLITVVCDWPLMAFIMVLLFDWSRSKGVTDHGYGQCDAIAFCLSAIMVGLYDFTGAGAPLWHILYGMIGPSIAAVLILVFLDVSKRPDPAAKSGSVWKYFFYVFYPGHLLLLWWLNITAAI